VKFFQFTILAAIGLFFFSCEKESSDQLTPANNTTAVDYEMLHITKPEWLIYKVDAGGTDVWQLPGIISTCSKDDTYRFYKDSILTTFENKNICSGGTDSSRSRWQFIDGRKKVTATLLGTSDTATILELTDSTMRLFVNYMGTDATVFFKKK
jgi:hypothetical protein